MYTYIRSALSDQNTVEIVNTVQARARQQNGTVIADKIEESVRFQALCPGASLDDIQVQQSVTEDSGAEAALAAGGDLYFEDSVRTAREKVSSTRASPTTASPRWRSASA